MALRDELVARIRAQGKSEETAKSYWNWIARYLRFVKLRRGEWVHPAELGRGDVEGWLSDLANVWDCSPNTQNVALQAVCYLYREILGKPLQGVDALRAKRPQRVREVLDVSEVARVLDELRGVHLLVAQLIYGCGLRINDVAKLRIKDISFERCQLHLREGKGAKDRFACFPEVLHEPVRRQLESMRVLHRHDVADGLAGVSLPYAWARKSPTSRLDFGWWYLFSADRYSRCPRSGLMLRHHRHRTHLGAAIGKAAKRAGIEKRVTSHVLRHCYATHANELGVDVTILQQLLGHSDVRTTMIYVHGNRERATAAVSPLAAMLAAPDQVLALRGSSGVHIARTG